MAIKKECKLCKRHNEKTGGCRLFSVMCVNSEDKPHFEPILDPKVLKENNGHSKDSREG